MYSIRHLFGVVFIVLCCSLTATSKTTQLRISFHDGRSLLIDLTPVKVTGPNGELIKRMPIMTFSPTTVSFVLPSATETPTIHTIEVEDLSSMEPIETVTSGLQEAVMNIDNVILSPLGADMLRISGKDVVSASDVKVYDMSGHLMDTEVNECSDGLTLSLSSLQKGIYVIKVFNTAIKFIKK